MAPLILGLLGFARSIPGRFVTDFYRFFQTFLGDILSHSRVLFAVTTCSHTCFFSDDVLWGNDLINRVELFEEKSILVFPGCLEASE